MDIEPQYFFQNLREHSKDTFRGPSECYRLLTILNYNLTEEQLNASLIDLYLLHMFDKSNGLLQFILEVASISKFDRSSAKSLEIIYALINNFSNQIEQYILDINEKSLKILQSKASAKIKSNTLDVLLISFEKVDKCLENQERYLAIFEGLRACLIQAIHTDSVRQKEFLAVGLFTKRFGYLVSDPNFIKNYFITQLDNQMIKGPSQGILCGIFTGLAYFCESFPFSLENLEDAAVVDKLYKYIKDLSKAEGKNRFGNRAAIAFFGANMKTFIKMVMKEYKQWHKRLFMDWLKMGAEERKTAEITLMALLLSIGEALVETNKVECKPVLDHFIGWFKSIIRKPNATYTEKRLCVHGLKYFSSPLYKHYSKEDARAVFLLIMQNFEKLYILNDNASSEEWDVLPDYVQSLASFMRYQSFTSSEIYCLQRAVISMIKTFHQLKPLHHSVVNDALVMTLFYLKETRHFDAFLENIVYQGVVWSCSHQHLSDLDLEDDRTIVTVKNYFPLWRGLLKLVGNRFYDKFSIYLEDRQFILTKLVNELVKTLMILINKLNVNVRLKEDVIQTDIETAYQVERLEDFAIFLNVTDFYREAFNSIAPDMFRHCICKIMNHLVAKCLMYPLVSGFYKLLSFALKISNSLTLFDRGNVTLNQDVANCKETLSKFLAFLLHKMKQFKDELLISCLHVLLESPVVVVEPLLPECVGIFVTVFEVGRSYVALADMGLNTLEHWQKCMGHDEFEVFLLQVMPCLDSYLRSKSLGGMTQSNTVEKKRKTARALKKRTVLVELEPELVSFQKRVLRFVGSQNGKVCRAFVSPDHNFERKVTSDNLYLKVPLPYDDLSLEVYLEPFIMRVVELCLYSSDRKTRVMACELLQAFVMVFLGRTKQMPHSSLADLDDLLRSMAMPLLQLACDIDQVVRQIFEPLFVQLIHWYTSKVQRQSPHLAVIIEVLMEGVTHPTNSALRDFAGKCINEFVRWTIKQSSEGELQSDPVNVKVLVRRMRFFSGHPDLGKKLGAALIFNNIYKEIREERALLSIFSMELLHIFLSCLALLEYSNEEVDNTVLQITNAIGHLKRIFVEKPQVFRDVDPRRRVPSDIPEGNLEGLSQWLLAMTASRSKYCRDVSMELFTHLQPLCGSKEPLGVFVQERCANLLSTYAEELKKYPTLEEVDCHEDATALLKWLRALLCLIDGHVFVIRNSLCPVDLKLESISYFLKCVQTINIEQGLKLIYKNSPVPPFTEVNKGQFVNLKAQCCLAILELANAVAGDRVLCDASLSFWNRHLWDLVLNFVFNVSSLGFDEKAASRPEYLDALTLLLGAVSSKLKRRQVDGLVAVLRKYVADNFDVDVDLRRNVSLKQRGILKGLLLIQASRLNSLFKAEEFCLGLVDKLMGSFSRHIEDDVVYIGRLSEITAEYCSLILKFALTRREEFAALLTHLYRSTSVSCQELADIDSQMSFGLYMLTKFADPVVQFLVNHFDQFLEGSDNIELVVKLTTCLLRHLEDNRGRFRNSFDTVAEAILGKWFVFGLYFQENNVDLGLDFIRQVWKLFGRSISQGSAIQEWLVNMLSSDEALLSEQEGINLRLSVFSVLAEVVVDDDVVDLSLALEKLRSQLEPIVQANVESDTITEKLLFTTIPTVKSQTILRFLMEFFINNTQTTNSDIDLTGPLRTFMAKNAHEDHQAAILRVVYRLALDENAKFEQKKMLMDHVLSPIFKNSHYSVFEGFFQDHIREITEELRNPSDLGKGLVHFLLVELLFLRIPIGSEERTHCVITEASGNPKLRAHLLKIALDVFRNNSSQGNKDHQRLYKCATYKALASIVSNSIKTEIFYEKLFVREENDEDILWRALIDTEVAYNFSVDFDSYPKKRKVLINIRDELRRQNDWDSSKSLKYIESQRLFNSSLSEDVTKFDFTNSVLRNRPPSGGASGDHDLAEENVETTFVQSEISLEATEINSHELMGTVCGIIEHIFASGVCQLPEDPEDMLEFPRWMDGIRTLLLNPNTHKNVKIFWVKVIDNTVHVFRHFAKYFVEPLLRFLNDHVAGTTINYFVTDVIVLLASWTGLIQPDEKEAKLASECLDYLIRSLRNERQDSFQYYLGLIKLYVENWREFVEVPYDSLYAKLNFDVNDRQLEVGIHLVSIFLVNNLLPCKDENLIAFWEKLTEILRLSSVSTIYRPCAETVGLMLGYFKKKDLEQVTVSPSAIVSKDILDFVDISKYAGCLKSVAIHYPDMVDDYHIIKMLNRLSQSDPHLQGTYLKIIFRRTDILANVKCFRDEDWSRYLESRNAEVQLISLEIILKTFQILKREKSFKDVLKSVSKNLLNPNVLCRSRMYDVLMAVLELGDIDDQEVLELCKEVLIQGLVDTDLETREKIYKFWSENPTVPSGISDKFPYLMSNFYLAKTEEHFLGYVSYFLLDSFNAEEFEKELFEHPLEDCDFEEYQLQTNWRLQHPSVVPLFAETLRTYTEGQDDISRVNFGELRATQDNFTFAPTQQTVRERHISQITSIESSLIGGPSMGGGGSKAGTGPFINPNAVQLSEKYKLPKRRFLSDKAKIAANFAHVAVAQKIQKTIKRYDAAKEKEKKVTIYRSYRKGDLPDIQITLGCLVKPLQMLVLHDGELSKLFFSVTYKTLKDKLGNTSDKFTRTVSDSIQRIFTNSVQYNANVFSTLLDVLLKSQREIRLDPGLISTACQQSGLISAGTLLLEEYLMSIEDVPGSSKRGNGMESVETRHWLKLAELYKELHEWNLVRTIFLEKSNCKEEVHKAIILESDKRWREAQEKYEQLLKKDLSTERQDFYYESYFKCLAHLGEWEKLPGTVESLVPEGGENTWNSLWDGDWFQQKILPWYVGAKIKNVLFSGNDCAQFLMDVNKSLSSPEQADYLKHKFSEELCVLWLTQRDTAQATQYLKTGLEAFLGEWQLLNPMFGNLRYNKILNLRTLIEIDRFLDVEKILAEESIEENLRSLQDYWKSTQKEFLPSILLSEAKLLYRKLFNKLLLDKLTRFNQLNAAKELKKTNILLDISFMELAVEEENYYMTRKYYRDYANMKHPSLTMIYGSLAYLYSNLVKNDPGLKLEKLLESLRKFREIVQSTKDHRVIASLQKIFDISRKVTEVLSNNPDLYGKYEQSLGEIFGREAGSPMEVASMSLKTEALKHISDREPNRDDIVKEKTKALVKLAYFVQDRQDQEQDFILYVLRAMKLGSKEARQLFPCILLKDSLEDELKDLFISETEDVPTWMFLGWIPQLLANADSPKINAISEIILRIAKTYPQAIMYSYRLSKENYSNTDNACPEETKRLTDELDRLLLNDPLVDKFLTALCKVSVPLVSLDYYIKKMAALADLPSIMKNRDNLMEFFFKDRSDSKDSSSMQGNMYLSIKDFKNDFQSINARHTLKKVKDSLKTIEAKRRHLLNPPPKVPPPKMSKMLKDYCPWLANFSAGRMNLELEIPGQYSGEKLPLVQHHVKISGFCENVSVMASLRRPIKVTMLGMDSREYPFLIKFGEDIRQDQRIQQLFMLMNNIFASDNKSHHILTYQVIPLTSSLGIIQWVENTVSLEDFLRKSFVNKRRADALNTIHKRYESFLERHDVSIDQYGFTVLKRDRNKVIPFFQGLVNEIPLDALRKSVWAVSLTTESFIAFRDNFVKSYATICACHWLLGIGDRHLQNSKVCTKNGKVLGIDFGHAFGTATQILPVPELVPIRLTPHLVGLMEPLKEKGPFRDILVDCLRSLRENSAPLLATMNVFIQEPSVDWLENARKFQTSDLTDVHQWYPLQKIDQAKRKLEGASSSTILIEDLKSSSFNRSRPQYYKKYIALVEGERQYDLRARLSVKETLSVEEQVDSLIDHATDRNLLGRMYVGWFAAV